MSKIIYGGDYNPEQWLDYPEVVKKDIEMMKKAGMNEATVGVFSWAKLEPSEGDYQFDWLHQVIDTLWENGISVILATPSGARPRWLANNYPEVLRIDKFGIKQKFGKRHNHCLTSEAYRKKVFEIDQKLAEEFGNHPAVKYWHISNELSGDCFCEKCQEAFRGYLKEKYISIDDLNRRWWTTFWSHTYSSFDEIEPPFEIGENGLAGLILDWKRFVTYETGEFIENEKRALKAGGATQPVTINLMGDFDGLDYGRLHEHVDIVSWDSYPEWGKGINASNAAGLIHDQMRSYKNKPFLLMESCPTSTNWQDVSHLKRPGLLTCASIEAIGHGADSVQYFQIRQSRGSCEKFHGALIDHTGRDDTRVFKEATKIGEILKQLDEIAGTSTDAKLAIIYDMQNHWALDVSQGPRNIGIGYPEYVHKLYASLKRYGIDVDVIDQEHDFSNYKVVFAPLLYSVRLDTVNRIRDFTNSGGTLAMTHLSAYVDECDLVHIGETPYELTEVLGLRRTEVDGLYDDQFNEVVISDSAKKLFKKPSYRLEKICELVEVLHDSNLKVLGFYGKEFYKGYPVMTSHVYGKGKAYYLAADCEDELLLDFAGMILRDTGLLNQELSLDMLPVGLNLQTRQGDGCRYFFFENYTEKEISAPIITQNVKEVLVGSKDLIIKPYDVLIVRLHDK